MKHPCEDCRRNCDEPCWKVEHGILVEVVRCKDCKHLTFSDCYGECGKGYMGIANHDDFCSYGERREDE